MKYIVIVHKDDKSCFGVIVPDYPGCFSAADTFEDIQKNVQEAIEIWADGEDFVPATPSTFEHVASMDEAKDGMLMIVDVNFDFADSKAVPVNITMPKHIRNYIDARAKSLGVTRSRFIQDAVCAYRT